MDTQFKSTFRLSFNFSSKLEVNFRKRAIYNVRLPTLVDLQKLKVAKLEKEGGWKSHQRWFLRHCWKSIVVIVFREDPDRSQIFYLQYKYLATLLNPIIVDLQKLKVAELEKEGGWTSHQGRLWRHCSKSIAGIVLRGVLDWSQIFYL